MNIVVWVCVLVGLFVASYCACRSLSLPTPLPPPLPKIADHPLSSPSLLEGQSRAGQTGKAGDSLFAQCRTVQDLLSILPPSTASVDDSVASTPSFDEMAKSVRSLIPPTGTLVAAAAPPSSDVPSSVAGTPPTPQPTPESAGIRTVPSRGMAVPQQQHRHVTATPPHSPVRQAPSHQAPMVQPVQAGNWKPSQCSSLMDPPTIPLLPTPNYYRPRADMDHTIKAYQTITPSVHPASVPFPLHSHGIPSMQSHASYSTKVLPPIATALRAASAAPGGMRGPRLSPLNAEALSNMAAKEGVHVSPPTTKKASNLSTTVDMGTVTASEYMITAKDGTAPAHGSPPGSSASSPGSRLPSDSSLDVLASAALHG